MDKKNHFRAIWISDVHLGTRECKAEYLLDFLRHNQADVIYLVGDIIDGWALKRGWYWHQTHNDVIQKLLRQARKGTRVVYIPGNHDEFARAYTDSLFGGIEVLDRAIHTTADGKRLLITHGDEMDGVIACAKWLAHLGDRAYALALRINRWFNHLRLRLGYSYWSVSAYLKDRVKNAAQFVTRFEECITAEAAHHGVDGVVCGHIHKAEIRTIGDILYCNDGDWVESCSALVEHGDGKLEILYWDRILTDTVTTPNTGLLPAALLPFRRRAG
jgi:UDP-2,3-diacylglucosamine pyrophosphatase LpxH